MLTNYTFLCIISQYFKLVIYFGGIYIMKDKIVLAYSGGLDTSTIVPWLKNNYDCGNDNSGICYTNIRK